MRAYIKKLQSKKEETRKQIFAGVMIVSMSFVVLVWFYSLGDIFSNPKVKEQTNEDIKPFKLFSNSISDTYKSIGASVGKIPSVTDNANNNSDETNTTTPNKQIDLIPVENTNQ